MLSITVSLSSLLLLPKLSKFSWHMSIIALFMITILSFPLLNPTLISISISPSSSLDSMAGSLILLTLWISGLMFLASYNIKLNNNSASMFQWTSLSLTLVLCLCFSASNLMSFYVWFEASLIPTMMLIMIWGYQPERIQASMYLMLYTVTASLPLLLILCKVYLWSGHLLMTYPWFIFPGDLNFTMGWALMILAFLVKLPLFSTHLWLPKAHVEAPVAGSMVLAAILLKLGGYGLIRAVTLFPAKYSLIYSPLSSLALTGAVVTSLMCLRQTDLKSLIAYSSVGHMGLMIAGIMSNTKVGMYGALAMMIAHGLVSSSLFCMANITYEFTHTRSIALTKGLLVCMPLISMWWFLLVCANMAAPPSINLLSEILLITGTLSHATILIIPLALISFFTAAYSLYLYSAINHGWMSSLSNPYTGMSTHYHLLMILHIVPVVGIIISADMITNWL